MIRFEDVSKVYQTKQGEVRALDGASFEVEAGEMVAVRGPSGCGKSTLLSLAGGLTTPTSGRVTVGDVELSGLSYSERAEFRAKRIGFVFQMFHLLPYLSVLDNVLLASANHEGDKKRRAVELLDQFNLAERISHRPAELSIGERQRAAIARAVLNDPEIILADEPTGNLDPQNANAVLDLLIDFQQGGGTVILATHDEAVAQRAGRALYLRRGQLERPQPAASGG